MGLKARGNGSLAVGSLLVTALLAAVILGAWFVTKQITGGVGSWLGLNWEKSHPLLHHFFALAVTVGCVLSMKPVFVHVANRFGIRAS